MEISALGQEVSARDGEIGERDAQIANLHQAVGERDAQIANLHQAVGERDAQIANLHQAVGERDAQIANLHQAVGERDAQIVSLHQAVGERDLQIATLHQAVGERNSQIATLNQVVVERETQIASLNQLLSEILNSKSWLLTKPLRLLRRNLLTHPSEIARKHLSVYAHRVWRQLPLSIQVKHQLKSSLFSALPTLLRHTQSYQKWDKSRKTCTPNGGQPNASEINEFHDHNVDQYVPLLDNAVLLEDKPAKLICFYLPQFHPIPENDAWWGVGFTEWTNVQPAQPQFLGHYQPHVPGELGYYNLLDPSVQRRQVALAKLYGIEGFCFYLYWFGGKHLLETPIENYLNDSSLDLPFCLCWANENWSRRWDGEDNEILIAQDHSADDDLSFIQYVASFMRDLRYIRISGKPLLLVYRPSLLPSALETSKRWRKWCKENGIGEIYLAYTQSFEIVDPAEYGFDGAIEFPPNNSAPPKITDTVSPLRKDFGCTVFDWRVFVERSEHYTRPDYTLFRSVCPSWDNTARRKEYGTIFLNNTPKLYQRWLENAIAETLEQHNNPEERLVFVNAWNEWAEGAHLEPDTHYGYAWLQATRNALESLKPKSTRHILIVTHDCHPHGAQLLTLEMTRQLVRNGYKPAIIALDGGKLQDEFAALGPMIVVSASGRNVSDDFLKMLRGAGCINAITSTVVSGSLLPKLKERGFRVISLIHELPGVIRSMNQEKNARRVAQFSDKIVFPAELVSDQYKKIAPVVPEKIVIRAQGLIRDNPYKLKKQEALYEVCRRHGLPKNSRIILNIGYLDHRKGADLFIEIAEQVCQNLEDTIFIWVGHTDDEIEGKSRNRIAELGLQNRVLLVGYDPNPLVYYAAASVYALTSREDPFPNVVLESASVDVPIVAFENTTGAAEFIVQQGGRLARHLDIKDFSSKLEGLLSSSNTVQTLSSDFSLQRYILDLLYFLDGTPRVSVIVPNYNYGRLIESRLESIRKQNHPIYEIIILDDASNDDSVCRIESFCQRANLDAQVYINKINSGSVFRQWVKGVHLASGDLVWIAEADDLADPCFLSELVPAFGKDEVVLSFCQSKQIDGNGCLLADNYLAYTEDISDRWRQDHFIEGMDEIRTSLSIKNVIPNVSGVIFNRQALRHALEKIGEDLFNYQVAGDWLVYLHVLSQGQLYYSSKSLNSHRRHQRSVTSATKLKNHLAEVKSVQSIAHSIARPDDDILLQAMEYLERLYKQFGLDESKFESIRDAK